MLTDFLEKLRQKPEETRTLFMWVATALIMLIIIGLWLAFGIRQNPAFQTPQSSPQQEGRLSKILEFLKEAKGDFLYLKDSLSKTMGDFLSGKNEPKEIPPELEEYLPEEPTLNKQPMMLPETE